ncbi:hypothetical protein [Streptomyces sp. NPDC058268]|uniref:hypothetical protein n=1 Tax=Streptomyces sp. NPDC058268 TaxID=3346413 RepID=UPI0036F03B43
MFAIAVHLMLMRVLTIGLAAIVRSSAGASTVLFVLLLAAWTAASLTLAMVILRRRDA